MFRAADQARSNGVVEDVLEGLLVVVLVVDDPGGEAFPEERAAAAVARIVLAGVVALVPLRGSGEGLRAALENAVLMRSHEAVGVPAEREPG